MPRFVFEKAALRTFRQTGDADLAARRAVDIAADPADASASDDTLTGGPGEDALSGTMAEHRPQLVDPHIQPGQNREAQPDIPISGATTPPYDPHADKSKPANETTIDDIVDAIDAFGRKADEVALGILGPAYEPALGLLKLVQAFSPMADVQDLLEFSHVTKEGIVNLDVERTLTGTADLGAAFAGMFVPGSVSGARKIARAAESGSGPGGGKYRRDIANMPPQQRAKIKGDPPVIPSSPEENIERGYAAIRNVLSTGEADMAAMFRKDLGWIAFESGEAKVKNSGKIVGAGLTKIIQKHPKYLGMLPPVIAFGKLTLETRPTNVRSAIVDYKGYRTVFRFSRFGKRET